MVSSLYKQVFKNFFCLKKILKKGKPFYYWVKNKKKVTNVLKKIYRRYANKKYKRYKWNKKKLYRSRLKFIIRLNKISNLGIGVWNYIKFSLLQMLDHNIQFGTLAKTALFSSGWFVVGSRLRFLVIDLNFTFIFFRKTISVICGTVAMKRHVCLVNDHKFMFKYFNDLLYWSGEPFLVGNWYGGTISNYKRVWHNCVILSRFQWKFRSYRKMHIYESISGILLSPALPGVTIVNSAKRSRGAAKESRLVKVPTFNLVDTDSLGIDSFYPLPSNDDAACSFYFFNCTSLKAALLTKAFLVIKIKKRKIFRKQNWLNKIKFYRQRVNFERNNISFKSKFFNIFLNNFLKLYYKGNYSLFNRLLISSKRYVKRKSILKHKYRLLRFCKYVYNDIT